MISSNRFCRFTSFRLLASFSPTHTHLPRNPHIPFTICAFRNQIMQCINVPFPANIIPHTSCMSHAIHSYFKFGHSSIQKIFVFDSVYSHMKIIFVHHTAVHSNMNKYEEFMGGKCLRNLGNTIVVIRFGATNFSREAFNQTMFQHILPPRFIHSVHLFSFFHSNRCELLDARHFASHHMLVILFIFPSSLNFSLAHMCWVWVQFTVMQPHTYDQHMCVCIACIFGDARQINT